MSEFLHHFLIGAAGAAAFEGLKLWELQGKLDEAKFREALKSLVFWLPLLLMLSAAGFFAWAYYDGVPTVKAWDLVIAGVGARTLIREAISGGVSHTRNIPLG